MQFLLISQRAIPNPKFSLKDLPGHGRFDIIPRCILSANRELLGTRDDIYCFLKGKNPNGWIYIKSSDDDDEISLASKIKNEWNNIFHIGNLSDLLEEIGIINKIILLSETGDDFQANTPNDLVVLGAQKDITEEDIQIINKFSEKYSIPVVKINLGNESLLASQSITVFRQLSIVKK